MANDLPAAAVAYARREISVFPLQPRRKDPYGYTTGWKAASNDPELTARRWAGEVDLPLRPPEPGEKLPKFVRAGPRANIGIATGAASGFWVLDVDGEEAEAALSALEAQHGALPPTVQQVTGRGRHLCFRWDPDGPEMRNRSKVGGAPIDVRGNGGYIVAPPSIHPGDEKKGIPPGRVYAWAWGRSPDDLPFADAPAWLVELCKPRDTPSSAAVVGHPSALGGAPDPTRPVARPDGAGRGTRYGEAVLDSCVRTIVSAQKGTRDSTLYRFACKAAGLVPTGHLQAGYLREALVAAGGVHVPDAMTQAQLERQVDRAIAWGAEHAWGPDPERRTRAAVGAQAKASPVQQAVARADALAELERMPRAAGGVLRTWCGLRELDAGGVPGAAARLRLAEIGGRRGFALALQAGPGAPPDGLAVFALEGGGACLGWKGIGEGRVAVLAWPEAADSILVATHLADAWALGEAAFEAGDPMAVVLAPRLSTFAGGPLGDRFGRVNLETPQPDPARPAWTWPGMAAVYLAVRRDLRGPELKVRKALGGTRRGTLEGDAAARFWGGLAARAWRSAGANGVRVMTPPGAAVGFCESGAQRV